MHALCAQTIVAGSEPWHVQLKTPSIYLNTSGEYTLTFWAKSRGRAQAVTADMLTTTDFSWVDGVQVELSTEWSQFQLGPVRVPETGVYVYTINVGGAADSYYFGARAAAASFLQELPPSQH